MTDMAKVMTWLEICGKNRDCSGNCPYGDCSGDYEYTLCREDLMAAALALLKEQEAMMQSIKGKCRICPHCANCDVDDNGLLKEQETVVRCVDCRYGQYCTDGETTYQCFKWNSNEFGALHEQDWFCADGERK